jgi:hypothetical protein
VWRWQTVPWLIMQHPELRDHSILYIFWTRKHVWLPFALAGLLLRRRNPLYLALTVPWLIHRTPPHGNDPRGRFRELSELPACLVEDVVEFAALAYGSVKHRTLFL